MKPLIDPQELARRNNEAAEEDHVYRQLRRARRGLKLKPAAPVKLLDALDRLEAKRLTRKIRAVGFFMPKKT